MSLLLILFACFAVGLCAIDVREFGDNLQDLEQVEEDLFHELRQERQQQPEQHDVLNSLRNKPKPPDSSDSSDDKKNACKRCREWHREDRRDTTWLHRLHREIPCPCTSQGGYYGHYPPNSAHQADWTVDHKCSRFGQPSCSIYHPYADGCMLSTKTSSTGARQQCCYTRFAKLMGVNDSGVGTPHRYSDSFRHKKYDVKPFKWCCVHCKSQGYCHMYKNLRLGTASHCK